jgi:hypothetical protein
VGSGDDGVELGVEGVGVVVVEVPLPEPVLVPDMEGDKESIGPDARPPPHPERRVEPARIIVAPRNSGFLVVTVLSSDLILETLQDSASKCSIDIAPPDAAEQFIPEAENPLPERIDLSVRLEIVWCDECTLRRGTSQHGKIITKVV